MVHLPISGVLESIKYSISHLEYSQCWLSNENLEMCIFMERDEEDLIHQSPSSGESCICLEEMLSWEIVKCQGWGHVLWDLIA